MTIYTLSLYRAARQLMTEDELQRAADLANDADDGSTTAAADLRTMVVEIVRDRRRIECAPAAGAD